MPKNEGEIKGYTIKYGNIINSESKEIIDEVLVSYFVKPKSYTTENMCEINSHGGSMVERAILQECLKMELHWLNRENLPKELFEWKNRLVTSRSCNGYN